MLSIRSVSAYLGAMQEMLVFRGYSTKTCWEATISNPMLDTTWRVIHQTLSVSRFSNPFNSLWFQTSKCTPLATTRDRSLGEMMETSMLVLVTVPTVILLPCLLVFYCISSSFSLPIALHFPMQNATFNFMPSFDKRLFSQLECWGFGSDIICELDLSSYRWHNDQLYRHNISSMDVQLPICISAHVVSGQWLNWKWCGLRYVNRGRGLCCGESGPTCLVFLQEAHFQSNRQESMDMLYQRWSKSNHLSSRLSCKPRICDGWIRSRWSSRSNFYLPE
jgi:hypothetical protein